jgi:hypothetical protein
MKQHRITLMIAIVAGLLSVARLIDSPPVVAQNPNPGSAPVNIVSPLPLPVTDTGLVPTKPSDVVTLRGSSPPTFCMGTGPTRTSIIETRILSDGTTQPFQIPNGEVLVVTGIDWTSFRTPPLTVPGIVELAVFLGSSPVFTDTSIIGAGTLGTNTFFPQGVSFGGKSSAVPNLIVKPDTQLCSTNDNSSSSGVLVHGFLTLDR